MSDGTVTAALGAVTGNMTGMICAPISVDDARSSSYFANRPEDAHVGVCAFASIGVASGAGASAGMGASTSPSPPLGRLPASSTGRTPENGSSPSLPSLDSRPKTEPIRLASVLERRWPAWRKLRGRAVFCLCISSTRSLLKRPNGSVRKDRRKSSRPTSQMNWEMLREMPSVTACCSRKHDGRS